MSTALHSFIDIFDTEFGEGQDAVQLKKITIPIIQRDYAQGRKDPDVNRVRSRFLDSLYAAVTEKPITLDFVYGDIDDSLVVNAGYGYRINDFYHLITDLQEFERYIANAKAQPDIAPRIEEYKKAVKLYRGPVYREASHEHWLLATAEHYAIEYLFAVNQLLKDLAELKDYQSVQHFASKALEIEPGNAEAVYWLIAALMKIGSVQSAQAEYDRAKQMLPEPAFKELQEKLLVEQIYLK